MNTQTNAIHELFAAAVELQPAERSAMIDRACAADAEMRRQVDSLLAAHDRAGRFLADPAFLSRPLPGADAFAPGAAIGPYTLLKMIGEGGYGTVYLAEQERPIARRVALKVIKAGMDTRQVIARFELERQALAVMNHPNIAQVFDAGATEAGRPYFAMELIEGKTITDYCRHCAMDVRGRLALFADVCDAVQHAHHKGVIHRDIKPSNVLVSMGDGKPVVKVIDFGIAKALDGSAAAGAGYVTEQPQLLGTPQCMSPEQAATPPVDVDTRTDVYSLGVLLYELLTDAEPFDPARLRSAAYAEMRRVIREVDPPTPSARLSTPSGVAPESAIANTAEIRRRVQQLRGELDWVVMKAMEKDRQRRYGTVDALATDIARYLNDEPVSAGRPGRWHRLRRFARRNRRTFVTAAIISLSLVAGTAAATVGFVRARHDRDRAENSRIEEAHQRAVAQANQARAQANEAKAQANEARAQTNEARARAEADRLWAARTFLYRLLSPPFGGSASDVPPREMLDYVAKQADAGALSEHRELEAPIRAALGNAYLKLKMYPQAEHHYRANLELCRALEKGDSLASASALNNLSSAVQHTQGPEAAEPLLRESLAMYRRIRSDNGVDAPVMINLAVICANSNRLDEAESLLRPAIDLLEKELGKNYPVAVRARKNLADVLAAKQRNENH